MGLQVMLDGDLLKLLESGKIKQETAMLSQLLRNTDSLQQVQASELEKKQEAKEEEIEFLPRQTGK